MDIPTTRALSIYLKIMIDGMGSRAFSAQTLPSIPKPAKSYVTEILGYSRKHYGKTKDQVDADIRKWSNKDFHLENVKFAEEKAKKPKKEGDIVLNAMPTSGNGVFLNEMGGYDAMLLKDAERLRQMQGAAPKATVAAPLPQAPKLDTKSEIDRIVEELMRGVDLPPNSPSPRAPRPVQSQVVKSGDMLGEEELSLIKEVPAKRNNQKRKKVLDDLRQDFSHKKLVEEVVKTDTKQTKIPAKQKNNSDDEIPEDVLRALLDL